MEKNFTFNKRLGQNFLSDVNLLQAIVDDADVSCDDVVLEIGPGAGALTKELAKVAKKVVAVEIDRRLEPILQENLKDFSNIEIIFGDFLQIANDVVQNLPENFVVVANIPYYVTTPIIVFFLENRKCKSLTLTIQKEVAERIVSKPNCKDYGSVSVISQAVADCKICRKIDRKMFFPVPDVDSAVLKMCFKNKHDIKDFSFFEKVVKNCFAMRRKTLSNNLKNTFAFRVPIEQVIESIGLSPSARSETLSIEQFVLLCDAIEKYAK